MDYSEGAQGFFINEHVWYEYLNCLLIHRQCLFSLFFFDNKESQLELTVVEITKAVLRSARMC